MMLQPKDNLSLGSVGLASKQRQTEEMTGRPGCVSIGVAWREQTLDRDKWRTEREALVLQQTN